MNKDIITIDTMPLDDALKENEMICMKNSVYKRIRKTVGTLPAETGGILGINSCGVISRFFFDKTIAFSSSTYAPSSIALEDTINRRWNPKNIELCGFVHSHPKMHPKASPEDIQYIKCVLHANPHMKRLILAIVLQDPFDLLCYSICKDG